MSNLKPALPQRKVQFHTNMQQQNKIKTDVNLTILI